MEPLVNISFYGSAGNSWGSKDLYKAVVPPYQAIHKLGFLVTDFSEIYG